MSNITFFRVGCCLLARFVEFPFSSALTDINGLIIFIFFKKHDVLD